MATIMPPHRVGMLVSRYIRKLGSIILGAILIVSMSSLVWSGSAHADAFGCYQGTGNPPICPDSSQPPLIGSMLGSKCVKGDSGDWHTTETVTGSDVTVLSFHGGNIETKTSQISADLQTLYNWNRYDFSGHVTNQDCKNLKSSLNPRCTVGDNYCILHITSTHFNDATALNLVKAHPRAVSIHGCGSSACSASTICVGGRNIATTQIADFRNYVDKYKGLVSGTLLTFDVPSNKGDSGAFCASNLAGDDTNNIVNKTLSGEGLQLEISSDIRNRLASDLVQDDVLRGVVYGGVARAMGELPVPLAIFKGSTS
ncbi:poly-gamma-glutamate hydrolase family protein [Brasilonema sp. UFV-L1]|uniref:poly-gamma-glutamate hydrolase family protein n=1 Tax=Brasilonema sp. UFV-L1 TaxID=2234130 RepID=UPI00403F8597